ncbi:MAG: ATP-binding protein [Nitrospinota bacterium]
MISRFLNFLHTKFSVGIRFSALLFITVSVTSVSLAYLFYREGFETMHRELLLDGFRITTNLADRNADFLMQDNTWELFQSVRIIVKSFAPKENSISPLKYAAILDKNNRIAAHSNPKDFPLMAPFEIKGINRKGYAFKEYNSEVEIRVEVLPDEEELYHFIAPITVRAERVGSAVVGISEKRLMAKITETRDRLIAISIILVSIFLLLGYFFTGRVLKPLTGLLGKLKNLPPKITEGIDLNLAKGDEISQFIEGFDAIIDRYGQVVDELKLEKAKLDGILNGINAGMILLDRNLNIEWQNRIYTQWFGNRIAKNCLKMSGGDEPLCAGCSVVDVFVKEEIISSKMKKRTLNNEEERTFNMIGAPLHDDTGTVTGALVLAVDITQLVQLEDEVKKNERLAIMGQMAAAFSHEIRNPMGALITALQIIIKENGKSTQDQKEKLLSVIRRETDRLNAILTDFLSFTHTKTPNIQSCDINLIVGEVMDVLSQQREHETSLTIEKNLRRDLPPALADSDMLKQVIWNLALNGLDAMKEKGGTLYVNTNIENGCMALRIKDTGEGMNAEALNNCFEPFYTRKSGGTGLGLAIAKKIIRQHKGEIKVKSEPGRGTEFCVLIPHNYLS